MRSRTQREDPAAVAERERARREAELAGLDAGMASADSLTSDLRKVYGLRRLGRPGAKATPGVQPGAAPMPAAAVAKQDTQKDRANDWAAINATRQAQGLPLIPQNEPALDRFTNPNGSVTSPDYSGRPDGLMAMFTNLFGLSQKTPTSLVKDPNKTPTNGGAKIGFTTVNPNQPTVSPKITTSTAPTSKTKTASQSLSKDKKR